MIELSNCQLRGCVHFSGIIGEHIEARPACKAFPDGIPEVIAYGPEKHLESIKGDGGVVFGKTIDKTLDSIWLKNCGIAAGGFQPGNTCAAGGGTSVASLPEGFSGLSDYVDLPGDSGVSQESLKWGVGLSDKDRGAILDWQAGTAFHFREAAIGKPVDPGIKKRMDHITEVLESAPGHHGVVYRGMAVQNDQQISSLRKGAVVTMNAPASTSKLQDVAEEFAFNHTISTGKLGVIFKMKMSGGGVDIVPVPKDADDQYRWFHEVVAKQGTKFAVTKRGKIKKHGKDSYRVEIEMEEVT